MQKRLELTMNRPSKLKDEDREAMDVREHRSDVCKSLARVLKREFKGEIWCSWDVERSEYRAYGMNLPPYKGRWIASPNDFRRSSRWTLEDWFSEDRAKELVGG